jgi:hypothetical protein
LNGIRRRLLYGRGRRRRKQLVVQFPEERVEVAFDAQVIRTPVLQKATQFARNAGRIHTDHRAASLGKRSDDADVLEAIAAHHDVATRDAIDERVDRRRILVHLVDVEQKMVRRLETAVQLYELEARLESVDEFLHLVFDCLAADDALVVAEPDPRSEPFRPDRRS